MPAPDALILSDDGPDKPSTPRLCIHAGDDYYVSVVAGPDASCPSVRFCTSGGRDDANMLLVAALYRHAIGDHRSAALAARAAAIALDERYGGNANEQES